MSGLTHHLLQLLLSLERQDSHGTSHNLLGGHLHRLLRTRYHVVAGVRQVVHHSLEGCAHVRELVPQAKASLSIAPRHPKPTALSSDSSTRPQNGVLEELSVHRAELILHHVHVLGDHHTTLGKALEQAAAAF